MINLRRATYCGSRTELKGQPALIREPQDHAQARQDIVLAQFDDTALGGWSRTWTPLDLRDFNNVDGIETFDLDDARLDRAMLGQ